MIVVLAQSQGNMYCVYCGKDHDETVALADGHVVPYAVGGSNLLTIKVCRDSDNALGGRIEKPFIEAFPVRAQRFSWGLRGTDGTEPTLDLGGLSWVNGRNVRADYTIKKGGEFLQVTAPSVQKRETQEGEHWTVCGNLMQVSRILEGKLVSLLAKGGRMKNEAGELLTLENLGAFINSAPVQEARRGIVKRIDFDLLACYQFFIKMALSAGHFALGESFSRSQGADILRRAMHARDLEAARVPRALIWPQTEGTEHLLASFQMKDSHVLGVLKGEPPIFVASLFGTYNAFIPLASVEEGMKPKPPAEGRIFQIELPSRQLHDRDLEGYLLAFLASRRISQVERN